MEEIDKENMIYFHYKTIQTCICSNSVNDVENILSNYLIETPESLVCLLNPEWGYRLLNVFLEAHKNYMDDQMKENAFHVLWFFERIYENIDKNELLDQTNKLKIMINSSDDSRIKEMISEELITRLMDKKEIFFTYFEQNNIINYVKSMICNDLLVLLTHSPIYDNEKFSSLVTIYLKDTKSYIASLNSILSEYPEIKQNSLFTQRAHIILEKISDKTEIKLSLREKYMYKNFVKKITY